MSRFYFGDSDGSGAELSDNDHDSSLPFPKPLSRSPFLAPDFDPATFLSSLSNRHQSLADLRIELRDLSEALNKELLDLVNENYQDFLSLGSALKGGEEKVEEVRVGLLGFQRDVRVIKDQFEKRLQDIKQLLEEKKRTRSSIAFGHDLLDFAERIEDLECSLMISERKASIQGPVGDTDGSESHALFESESDETDEECFGDDTDGGAAVVSLRRLERHIQQYLYIKMIATYVGERHPFAVSQEDKVSAIKATLLLDLKTALNQAEHSAKNREKRIITVMSLYDLIGEQADAVSALQTLKA